MQITVDEAAKRLKRTSSRVRKLLSDGYIEGTKAGRDWAVDEESLEAYKLSVAAPLTSNQRAAILGRDRFTCQECGYLAETEFQARRLHVHHVIERDNGGTNDQSNLITLCWRCHIAKHPRRGQHTEAPSRDARLKLMRAYRLPEKTVFEIERLAEEWECTQAQVIERAIAEARSSRGLSNNKVSELKVEYDEG